MNREAQFEQFLGINTDEKEIVQVKEENGKYSRYETTHYEGLIKIFDEVLLKPTDTLVDFGCGLGRVLFYCNHRYMCYVTGVEYNHDIYKKLLDNADNYHARFQGQRRKFSLLYMKAEEYWIGPTDNFFYMFNPFSTEVLDIVLQKIFISAGQHPRKITFIFYYCTYEILRALRKYPLCLARIIKLPAYEEDPDEKAYVYTLNADA